MSTPDTEWEKEFDERFSDESSVFEGGDPYGSRRKSLKAFITHLLTSRDTYWKERVRKEVETEIAEAVELTKREIKHRVERYFKGAYLSLKQQGGVHIHLEEIQEIIDDSTPPGFDLTPLQEEKPNESTSQ